MSSGLIEELKYRNDILAVNLLCDVRRNWNKKLDDVQLILQNAKQLYRRVYSMYIRTKEGLEKMLGKYLNGDFGHCPRVTCKRQPMLPTGNDEIITNQIHDYYGPRSWDALFGYQNRIDDIGRNVQPYFGNVARRSMKQVDRLGGGILLRPSDPFAGSIGDGISNNTPEEAEETIRIVNVGQNGIARGTDRIQLRSLDHIGGGNLLKRSLDHIVGGNLLKRSLDSIRGGHLLKRAVDSIGGGYLLK